MIWAFLLEQHEKQGKSLDKISMAPGFWLPTNMVLESYFFS